MINPRFCCSRPPVIKHSLSATGRNVYEVRCIGCGRTEISGDKEYAVKKFNNGVKADEKSSAADTTQIESEVQAFKVRPLHAYRVSARDANCSVVRYER